MSDDVVHDTDACGRRVWTEDRIRALGVLTDLPTAAAIFGLSRTIAYELARNDAFPVPVIRAGARYRVPVVPILHILGIPDGRDLWPKAAAASASGAVGSGRLPRLDQDPDSRWRVVADDVLASCRVLGDPPTGAPAGTATA